MPSEERVKMLVSTEAIWFGVDNLSIEFDLTNDFEAYRHGQWRAPDYLYFARWDRGDPVVHACVSGSLLRHTDDFCDACVSAALSEFLGEEDRLGEYSSEWMPYDDAHAILARSGFQFGRPGRFYMVYPRGSFVRICDCGKAEVFSPAEVAFGRSGGLSRTCPHCGRKAHVGVVGTYVMTSSLGLYAEDDSGMSRMTPREFFRYRTLDLDHLVDAGLVDDIRNVGMAMFLQEGGMGFGESWAYLSGHPSFEGHFPECFDFDVAMVCHDTASVEDDSSRNSCPQVWVEGGWLTAAEAVECEMMDSSQEKPEGMLAHDTDLDTGGWTFEEAVCNLAMIVRHCYGDGNSVPVVLDDRGEDGVIWKE